MQRLINHLRGAFSAVFFAVNTVLWCIPFYVVGILRTLIPWQPWRNALARVLMALGRGWIWCNAHVLEATRRHRIQRVGFDGLDTEGWYLVISNHQCWADIPVLQAAFNGRIPFLKFFLKQELIWVPMLGLAWWFLDYPFMRRFSKEYLERHPEMRGKDLETTRRACEKFRHTPVSILNFLEGTRFTLAKHDRQGSPYRYLLKPKSGGVAFALAAMGDTLKSVVDVTIVYPEGRPTFWGYLSGDVHEVIVHVRQLPLPAELLDGDYQGDEAFRGHFQAWVEDLWNDKDATYADLAEGTPAA